MMGRFVDKRPFSDYGLNINDKVWWLDIGLGLLLGSLTMTAMFITFYLLNWVEITGTFFASAKKLMVVTVSGSLFAVIAGAVYPCLWIWSYTLRNTAEGFVYLDRLNDKIPVLAATVICLILFIMEATTGIPQPDKVLISNLFRAGMILALPFILTQRLGLSIGLFLGWTVFQVHIYGMRNLSLAAENPSMLVLVEKGPDLWTGGDGGLSSGLVAMIALLLLSGIITAWEKRRTGKSIFNNTWAQYEPPTETR